jgi:serine/threonine-protein kinase
LASTRDKASETPSRVDTLPEHFADMMRRNRLAVGDVIGERYQIVQLLGLGAMGQVFVAENLAIGIRVAVKLLKPELLANADFRRRFQHEAQAVAAVQHACVARFHDLIVGDPTFLVMEYVPGFTLADVLKAERKLTVGRATAIATRLAWGLQAVHAAGIIHRDLKPANIVIASDAEHGELPKLIDFGLAKLAAATEKEQLTRTGQIVGTPPYMAPEQIAGREVDARADQYALGCLLYEMIAGRPPFGSGVGGSGEDVEVLYRQVHEPAEPLTAHSAEVPPALDAAVRRALEKDAAKRFANMSEFARALAATNTRAPAVLKGGTIETQLLPRQMRDPRVRWLAAIAGVLCVATAIALVQLRTLRRPKAAAQSLLMVASEPAGATVEVDGKPLAEITPTAVRDLPVGRHDVRVSLPGRTPVARHVTVGAGQRSLMQIALPPASHRLEVRTVPDGATLFLDSQLASAVTPATIDVTDDDFHELRVERSGYESITKALSPEDKQPLLVLPLSPEQKPRGTLMVDSNGVGEVWIDGAPTGFTTPTIGIRVAVGDHMVELRDGHGNRVAQTRVRMHQGDTHHLTLSVTEK